jgi:hypothetical protein
MFFLMVADLATTVYFRLVHRIMLTEPSTGLALSTTPFDPMRMYKSVADDHGDLDILVLADLEYIYFFRYAPAAVASRLYYGATENYVNLGGYERLAKEAHVGLQTTTFKPFLATHDRFLVYQSGRNKTDLDAIQAFAAAGYRVKSVKADVAGIMYEYGK